MPASAPQRQLIDDFALIENRQERLAAVVDRARRRPPLPESERTEANRVAGCVSQVWVVGEIRDERCHFRSDADGPLVRGLVVFLCDYFCDVTPAGSLAQDTDPLEELGLLRDLTPTRRNGLTAVRATIRTFAQAQV